MFEKLNRMFGRNTLKRDIFSPYFDSLIEEISQKTDSYFDRLPFKDCNNYQYLKALPFEQKIAMLFSLTRHTTYYDWFELEKVDQEGYKKYIFFSNLLTALMRTRIDFPQGYPFSALFDALYTGTNAPNEHHLGRRPFGLFVTQIEKHAKNHGPHEELNGEIEKILQSELVKPFLGTGSTRTSWGSDIGKAVKKLRVITHESDDGGVAPFEFGSGIAGKVIRECINQCTMTEQDKWHALFHHLATAGGSKPTKKFTTTANQLVDAIGNKRFKESANQCLQKIAGIAVSETQQSYSSRGRVYTYNTYEFIESSVIDLLKGLCWTLGRYHDQETLKTLALMSEKAFQKIPGQGPAAAAIGNAAIYALAQSKGLGGIGHLSRLKLRIRQNNTRKLIQKYIDEQAKKLDISPAQVEELSAPDFKLVNGIYSESFGDYQLQLSVTGVGQTELTWLKPDGSLQKSVPLFVKNDEKHSKNLKSIRALAKQIKQASSAQRDRIDRLYVESISWDIDTFTKHYLDHGLICQIARKLIWKLNDVPGLYRDEGWQDDSGQPIATDASTRIELWHPIHSDADTVLRWRNRLETLGVNQPCKQAYREIYILTDAEINTRVYSNRMAGHFLKQHQLNALASARGWKYSLLGAFDNGRAGETASKPIPAYKMSAEFWIDEIIDDVDSISDTGIWDYIATDQIRFVDESEDPIPLVNVPPIVLSEVMRDADLFVGVASVGNDPTWQDGGPTGRTAYRDYWQGYSFGELNAVAKTRRTVLERLLPKLKIRDVARIDGKFLIVDGKKHTYKIHIGSGNILMHPNDRYLCIVPGRGKNNLPSHIFLPFEGDTGLSIVLV